ncbi:hypothetical protein SLEP1_g4961 [Rubroshorea leprosula]|uniref:RNase H type-1 domain-containing protein n=1 Tax=Rubroshorea leprosula TaxID=152421 RepID=A0AAV5HZ75_9ROSI|nr:hypothetical protein SLEP1_g4961 [Rubroshorea leprosula]
MGTWQLVRIQHQSFSSEDLLHDYVPSTSVKHWGGRTPDQRQGMSNLWYHGNLLKEIPLRFQGSVLQAEFMAIDFALGMGGGFGQSNVIIESNCVQAIQVAMSNNDCYPPLGAIEEELRAEKFHFVSLCFQHLKRSGTCKHRCWLSYNPFSTMGGKRELICLAVVAVENCKPKMP